MRFMILVALAGCHLDKEDETIDRAVCGDGLREGIEACDDGNGTSGDGCSSSCRTEMPLAVDWRIVTLAGAPFDPPPEIDTAEIVLQKFQPASSSDCVVQGYFDPVCLNAAVPEGAPISTTVPRSQQQATVMAPFGDYLVTVSLRSASTVFATSRPERRRFGVDGSSSHTMFADAGYVRVAWVFEQDTGLLCIPQQVANIDVALTGPGAPVQTTYTCDRGEGISAAVPAGDYTLVVTARGGRTGNVTMPITVPARNALLDLDKLRIDLP